MQFFNLYEKLQGLRSLHLLDELNLISKVEHEFSGVFIMIQNMTQSIFDGLDQEQKNIISSIIDFYADNFSNNIAPNIELIEDLEQDEYIFQSKIEPFEHNQSKIDKQIIHQVETLNDVRLWHYNNEKTKKTLYASVDGVPLELHYQFGELNSVIANNLNVIENAKYFDGMVKQLSDCMDCIITGHATLLSSAGDIGLEHIVFDTTTRDEGTLSSVTFIADNIYILKMNTTGENVI